jgi:putative spermidine/putrescine transport system permease protein
LTIALVTTVLCLIIGFPMALLLTRLSPGLTNITLFFVLLPFWTSILVRTLAWFVLLQREGIINVFLERVGVIDEPLHLMFNRASVHVSLVHVFLPYMVLPLYSVMKNVPALYTRAAASLGASPFVAFTRIYLPQVAPGVSAGCLLVFIQALGVYVTPAILGGADDQGISYMIAFYTNKTINWGMSAALSLVLLAATLTLYVLYKRLVGDQQMRMG